MQKNQQNFFTEIYFLIFLDTQLPFFVYSITFKTNSYKIVLAAEMLAKALVSEGKHIVLLRGLVLEEGRADRCLSAVRRSEKKLKYVILIAS